MVGRGGERLIKMLKSREDLFYHHRTTSIDLGEGPPDRRV